VSLGQLVELTVGYAFKSSEYGEADSGQRLVRGENIAQGNLRWGNTRWWPNSAEVDSRYELHAGDLVLAMDRPWIEAGLKFAQVSALDLPALLVQRVARLRARDSVDQRYLYYILAGSAFASYVQAVQTGTSIPHISGAQILGFTLTPHPLAEQRAISEVLGALDDKIAANLNLVATLESLARAIFEENLSEASDKPLSETAEFVNGRAFTKGASGTGRVVVRISELKSGIGGSTVYSDAEVADKHVSRAGDILFAWSGSLTLSRWFREDAIINQHIFKVIPKTAYPRWLVFQLIRAKLEEFKSIAADKATTMGHIQRHHLDELVTVPSEETILRMDAQMSSLWKRALLAEQESLSLAELRDTLLPELMSGRLRVKDAEKKIEEVV